MQMHVGEGLKGRIISTIGEPIDERGLLETKESHAGQFLARESFTSAGCTDIGATAQQLLVGIKVIDLVALFAKGGEMDLFGGAGVGKAAMIVEFFHDFVLNHGGYIVFASVGEPSLEGEGLRHEMKATGVVKQCKGPGSKDVLVCGQNNETPGARTHAALTSLTVAEFFRGGVGQDMLLGESGFRSLQLGSEVSAVLGCFPSAAGCQPRRATGVASLRERTGAAQQGERQYDAAGATQKQIQHYRSLKAAALPRENSFTLRSPSMGCRRPVVTWR